MGLFDALAKQALGGFFGNGQSQMLADLLQQSGGLDGLMNRFQEAGLGEVFASWVSTGENLPVQPGQLQQALGLEGLQDLARKLGFDLPTLLPLLSQFLPQVIDRLTPNGAVEDGLPGPGQLQDILAGVMRDGVSSFFNRRG